MLCSCTIIYDIHYFFKGNICGFYFQKIYTKSFCFKIHLFINLLVFLLHAQIILYTCCCMCCLKQDLGNDRCPKDTYWWIIKYLKSNKLYIFSQWWLKQDISFISCVLYSCHIFLFMTSDEIGWPIFYYRIYLQYLNIHRYTV